MSVMYPSAIYKASDENCWKLRKNEENRISDHGSCASKVRRFYASF